MPVVDLYTNPNFSGNVLNKLIDTFAAGADQVFVAGANFTVAASDSSGSVYRVFKALDANIIPLLLLISNPALAGDTSWDAGLYQTGLGAVINKNVFMSAQTLAVASPVGLPGALNGIANLTPATFNRRLFEHAGHTITNKREAYDLALTANTRGSGTGVISVMGVFAQG